LKAIPKEAEEIMIARDILLARLTKEDCTLPMYPQKVHWILLQWPNNIPACHCETSPHYFSFTDDAIADHLAMAKMNPPYGLKRTERQSLKDCEQGLLMSLQLIMHPIIK
jgi:dihydroorotase